METQAPQGFVAVQLLVANPGDVVMCGVAVDGLRPSVFAPDTPVYGRLPAGVRAVTLVADSSALHGLAADLGLRELDLHRTRVSMEATPAVQRLVVGLRDVARDPGLIEATAGDTYVLESLVRALAPEQLGGSPRESRRRASASIVSLAMEYVEQSQTWRPPMSELCRVAMTSESSLRAAFVDVLGMPPTTYLQLRVLGLLRRRLIEADPRHDTVTTVASSLGLMQFGRIAGRYKRVYAESPKVTLLRTA